MYSNRHLAAIILIIILLMVAAGCSTFYYKLFVVGGTPRYPELAIEIDSMWCYFKIEVDAHDKQSFQDSSYQMEVRLLPNSQRECASDKYKKIFETVQLDRYHVRVGDSIINLGSQVLKRAVMGPCWISW